MKKEKEIRNALKSAGIKSIAEYVYKQRIYIALHGNSEEAERVAKQYIQENNYLLSNEVLL